MFTRPIVTLMFAATHDYACVSVDCVFCGEGYMFGVSQSGYAAWCAGLHSINQAFPELDAKWREMMISGVCPMCWDNRMTEDEED